MNPPTALVILDGFGYSTHKKGNAIYHAYTPFLDYALAHYPHTLLRASGTAVGLPKRYRGNTQVGHATIGAGKIIPQPISIINDAIAHQQLDHMPLLLNAYKQLKKNHGRLHIIGLLSNAGIHSHYKHIQAYIDNAHAHGVKKIFLHLFLDGRDSPPQFALHLLKKLHYKNKATLGSVHGRFYAMDRDKNWQRTQKSYDCLTSQKTTICTDTPKKYIEKNYAQNISDEFIPPTLFDAQARIQENDGIIFANFRPDRALQLAQLFVDPAIPESKKQIKLSFFITPFSYSPDLATSALWIAAPVLNTLKQQLAAAGKTLFTCAETEKYAAVTYFFSSGHPQPFLGETQMLIPSLKTRDYQKYPGMSAAHITTCVLQSLKNNPDDFYLINYANADMVAHSGNFDATKEAIECLDKQLKTLYQELVVKKKGTLYITGDHGNAETMIDQQHHQPHTAHTSNKVPFMAIAPNLKNKKKKLHLKSLSDIASFILSSIEN